jgi:hypothetical protein
MAVQHNIRYGWGSVRRNGGLGPMVHETREGYPGKEEEGGRGGGRGSGGKSNTLVEERRYEGFRGNQKEGAGRGRGSGQSPTAWATRARKGRGTWDRSAGLGVAGDHRSPPVTIDACLSPNPPGRYVHLNRQTQTVGPLGPRKRRFLPPMLGDPHPSEAPDRPGGDLAARPKARAFVARSAHSSKTKRHSKGVRGEEVGRSVLGTGMVGWSDKEERERRTAAQRAGGRGAFGGPGRRCRETSGIY